MPFVVPLASPNAGDLPVWTRNLSAVVLALISDEGRLLRANLGFTRLAPRPPSDGTTQADVRPMFLHPSFEDLLAVHASDGEPVFEGVLNLVDEHGVCRSLTGAVHHANHRLMLVAEYDVADMERLHAEVTSLNTELAELQRGLARTNRALQANEAQLTQLSLTDPLTGLANRRQMMEFMAQAWQRSRRSASIFSIIMADIDFFKRINDQYGHDQGDMVLKAVSAQMQAIVRKVDLAARFGGEEFVIVVQDAAAQAGVELAERLRKAASELRFEQIPGGITCSYGVAQLDAGDDIEHLLKHADQALYESKHNGRNCVTLYQADI